MGKNFKRTKLERPAFSFSKKKAAVNDRRNRV